MIFKANIFRLSVETECDVSLPALLHIDISDNYLSLSRLNLTATLPSLLNINLGQYNMTTLGPEDMELIPSTLVSVSIVHVSSLHTLLPGVLSRFSHENEIFMR